MAQTLQPINPEQPNVFNGIEVSYGIAPILGAISDISKSNDRKAWNLYIINIETLIRDRRDKTATPEQIARNVHEVWAFNRLKEGWTYGEVRNDKKRQTPCLVSYEQLPEEEKAYDRNTALGTLKYILSLGFDIVKKE